MKIVIIGGVAGGASAAARLRRLDEKAEIVLLERGEYISYANCGLPYYIGGEIQSEDALTLQTPGSFFDRFNVDVRVEQEALSIDRANKRVVIRDETGEEYTESYDKLILSPGAEPIRPAMPGGNDPRIFTLRTIPDTFRIKEYATKNKPATAVVVGGGFIGLEMAENLTALGIKVTLVEMADHVLAPFDYDMACEIHHHLRAKGVGLRLNAAVTGFVPVGDSLSVGTSGGAVDADMVVLAIGVRPEGKLAKDAGLELGERGAILVDDHMCTSDPDIYAVGDAVEIVNYITGLPGHIPLAGPANKQGRIAADNICGLDSAYQGTQGSAVLKLFDRTAASTGLNESMAKAAEIKYDKVYTLSASHASYYPGGGPISVKLLFERRNGKILGAQLFGPEGVDKRCDVIATAIRAGMSVTDLTELELCYAPPYSSAKDPVNMAGFVAENVLAGQVRQYFWHDVDSLPRDGSVTLLDVRTGGEYERGHIEGAVNIPVDSLRDRLDELDPKKPLYVNCQSGLRSYIACRMLAQSGFDCRNLAGGYRLYELVTKENIVQKTKTAPCGKQD